MPLTLAAATALMLGLGGHATANSRSYKTDAEAFVTAIEE